MILSSAWFLGASALRCGGILAVLLVLFGPTSPPAFAQSRASENTRIVDGVNERLAGTRDFSADFVQILDDGLNQPRREEGHVYMDRSGRARWEYDYPETRLYLIDGDVFTDYLPADGLLRRRRVDDAFMDQMPLMAVLGQGNLRDEFERIDLMTEGAVEPQTAGTRVLRLFPRRETALEELVLEVDPQVFDIRRLFMRYQDGSTNDIVFSSVLTNTGLTEGLWEIVPAPGTEVVETLD